MEKFINVEKIKNHIEEFEINSVFYDEKYNRMITYINYLGFFLVYSIMIFGLLLFQEIIVFILLLGMLVGLFTYLFAEVIRDRILIPIYKDMYENGYYVFGYILFGDYRIIVDEFIYHKDDVDKLIKEIIEEYKKGELNE